MPRITPQTIQKQSAISQAKSIMEEQNFLLTTSIDAINSIFIAGNYSLKENSLHNRIQLINSVLYEHWKSGKEPQFFRNTIKGKIVYSLNKRNGFKSYKELIPLEFREHIEATEIKKSHP